MRRAVQAHLYAPHYTPNLWPLVFSCKARLSKKKQMQARTVSLLHFVSSASRALPPSPLPLSSPPSHSLVPPPSNVIRTRTHTGTRENTQTHKLPWPKGKVVCWHRDSHSTNLYFWQVLDKHMMKSSTALSDSGLPLARELLLLAKSKSLMQLATSANAAGSSKPPVSENPKFCSITSFSGHRHCLFWQPSRT